MSTETSLFDLAASFVLNTDRHIFLTGRAGTGKTTFLKHIREKTKKNAVVVAPTGVAAINAGGVTMHSFFQLPLGSFIPGRQRGFSQGPSQGTDLPTLLKNIRFNSEKRKLLEELELLIIDEVSMLRADMLDAMDGILRHYRKNFERPFGGVQVLYIGDLYQLPPVVSNDEWSMLSAYYNSMFFFDALVMQEARPLNIELDKIYRQSDERFIDLLNKIRNNVAGVDDLRLLNKHYDPHFYPDPEEGYIILTSHNYKADKINQNALVKLNGEVHSFEGKLNGDFNEHALPAEKTITLKVGAQVMFIRNDKGEQRRYYNGKIGVVSRINKEGVYVRFLKENEEILLEQEVWRNIRYQYNEASDKVEEEELGSFKQYPIRLAWAVTIHKSQGLTFEKAIVDAGQSFAAGQVYVALSRLTALSGLVLTSEITPAAISTDSRICAFSQDVQPVKELKAVLVQAEREYLSCVLLGIFDWSKLLKQLQDHHQGYSSIKLPHMAEALAWSAGQVNEAIRLRDVSERFVIQIKQLLQAGGRESYLTLLERLKAAETYFAKEMEEKLLEPARVHKDATMVKAKVAKYLKSLKPLLLALQRQKQAFHQAVMIAEGLLQGADAGKLLDAFEEGIRGQPEEAGKQGAASATVKEDSKTISLQLLRQGKSLDQIASVRGLAKSTIEGHLLHFLPTGEVRLSQIVDKEAEIYIRNAIHQSEQRDIGSIRNATGNTYSYSQIRAVLLQLEKEEQS